MAWADPEPGWSDQAEALHRCLGQVAEPAREVLRLRYADGLSAVAIAGKLRRTVDAVYQMLSRTHRALRKCVERELARVDQPAEGGCREGLARSTADRPVRAVLG